MISAITKIRWIQVDDDFYDHCVQRRQVVFLFNKQWWIGYDNTVLQLTFLLNICCEMHLCYNRGFRMMWPSCWRPRSSRPRLEPAFARAQPSPPPSPGQSCWGDNFCQIDEKYSQPEGTVLFSEGILCKIDEKYVEMLLFFLTRSETRDMSLAPHWACNQDLFQRTVIGHSDFKI